MTTENTNSAPAAPSPAASSPSAAPAPSPALTEKVKDSTPAPSTERPAWVSPEVQKAMDFDPFTPEGDEVKVPTTDGTPVPAEGAPAQPASNTPVLPLGVTPTPATQPVTPAVTPEIQALLESNRRLTEQVLAATRTPPAAGAEASDSNSDPFATVPDYQYNIPDPLVLAMNSEDPNERKTAIGHLIKGVAQGIHQTVLKAVAQRIGQLETHIPQTIQQRMAQAEQSRHVATDFYTKYPQLNNPNLLPLVKTVAENHMKTTGQMEWTPKLRDEIAAKVIESLSGVVATPGIINPSPAAPAMFGGNSGDGGRAQVKKGPKTQADHMSDIFT